MTTIFYNLSFSAIVRSKNRGNKAAIVPRINSSLTCWRFLIEFGVISNSLKNLYNSKVL